MQAVNESCKSAKLSLDIQYEKIKSDIARVLDEHYNNLVDYIDKANKKDTSLLDDLKNQLENDLSKVDELITKG